MERELAFVQSLEYIPGIKLLPCFITTQSFGLGITLIFLWTRKPKPSESGFHGTIQLPLETDLELLTAVCELLVYRNAKK